MVSYDDIAFSKNWYLNFVKGHNGMLINLQEVEQQLELLSTKCPRANEYQNYINSIIGKIPDQQHRLAALSIMIQKKSEEMLQLLRKKRVSM